MNIADRIQYLRKTNGLSQEELADKVGVSRQAVSKWESEQSVPDMEKIITMSNLFDVTTDYILKGIEPPKEQEEQVDAHIFVIVATVLNFIGLIVSSAVWYEKQVPMALVIGLVFMALGCMIFGVGICSSSNSTRNKAINLFWEINIWLLAFIPLSFIYNLLLGNSSAPYPLLFGQTIFYLVFWIVYIAICLGVNFAIIKRQRTK